LAHMAATFLTVARRKAARDNRVEFFTSQAERQALYMEEYVEPDKCFRQTEVKQFYDSQAVQIGVAFLIFLNFIVEAVAAQMLPEEDSKEEFVFFMLEIFFNTSFTIELIINLYGSWFFKFWKSGWNWFDFIIVGVSIISMVFPQLPGITVLRLFRAFRVFRLFKRIPSLRKIIEGVLQAIPGVTQAFIVMFILMGIWSVIGVEFFRDATPDYFGDFIKAMFTMFQVMTMDFSSIARTLMYDHDYPLASIFFITFLFICGIVMTNVVVAILLDRYLAAMDDNDAEDAMAKSKNFPTMYLEVDNSFKAIRKVSWDDWEKISKLLNEFPTVYLEERMEYGSRNVMPLNEWSVDDVSWWLNKIGFGRHVSTFGEDMISGKWLLKIREADLRMYKMNLGERKTFLNELHKLIMEQEERMDQIASLRKVFDRYDDNGNGLIDQDEFMKVWEDEFDTEHRIPEEAIMETLRSLDTNGDMVIDFGEFIEATNRLKEKVKNQQKEKEKTVDEEIEYTEELERDPSLSSSFGERNPRSSSGWVELTPSNIDKREPEDGGKFSNTGGKDRQGEDTQAEMGGAETTEERRRKPES